MIKLQNLTPSVYYNQSRDFQFIGRLFDIVLNSVKTNADSLYYLPFNTDGDSRLIDLMTLTLGFKSKHHYNIKQLTALCSAFTEIIKNKGTIGSVITATNTLLNAEGIVDTVNYSLTNNNTVLNLFLPQSLTDLNLLKDLLNYILPAGMSCNLIRELKLSTTTAITLATDSRITEYYTEDAVPDYELSVISKDDDNRKSEGSGDVKEALAKNTKSIIANSLVDDLKRDDGE